VAKWKRVVWLVGLAACFGGIGAIKADEAADARLESEARVLFKAVLADEPAPEPCELAPEWDTHPIPEAVARDYLGLTLHAELSGPYVVTKPQAILDLAGKSGALCSSETAKALVSERRKQFEAGSDRMLLIRNTGYSFPVFSDDYRTAVVVVSHSVEGWARTPDRIGRLPVQAVGYAAVYAKSETGWSRVTTIELWVS
jgi:hypothetical protein